MHDNCLYEIAASAIGATIGINDMLKVMAFSLQWRNRLYWIRYGHTEVVLNNGDSVKFTNCPIVATLNKHYFKSSNTFVELEDDFYPPIK